MDERRASKDSCPSLPLGVLAILAAAVCAFLPLREAALCGRIRAEIAAVESRMGEARDAIALLEAEIAQAGTPEHLFWLAGELGVELFRIEPGDIVLAEEDGDGGVV